MKYTTVCTAERARSERNVMIAPLCSECMMYNARQPCIECPTASGASGALCSSSPAASSPGPESVPSGLKQALESAAEALSIAVANLQHAARMCTPPPPLQQAGPGSSSDATPAPIAAECVAAQALFPFETGKAAGKSAGKGAGMDAVAREPVGAHAAAVNGATADAAPAPVDAQWAFAAALMQAMIPADWAGPFEKGKAAGKGAVMDAARAAAVGGATAADAAVEGPRAPVRPAAAPVGTAPSWPAQVGPVIPWDSAGPVEIGKAAGKGAVMDAARAAAAGSATAASAAGEGARAPVQAAAAQVGPAPSWPAQVGPGAAAAPSAEGWYTNNWGAAPWSNSGWQ